MPCSARAREAPTAVLDQRTEAWLSASEGRLLSARRALISLSAGLVIGAIVGLVATPRLLPLVSWTVTVTVAVAAQARLAF